MAEDTDVPRLCGDFPWVEEEPRSDLLRPAWPLLLPSVPAPIPSAADPLGGVRKGLGCGCCGLGWRGDSLYDLPCGKPASGPGRTTLSLGRSSTGSMHNPGLAG